jgi:hypothetical protein
MDLSAGLTINPLKDICTVSRFGLLTCFCVDIDLISLKQMPGGVIAVL